MLHPRAILLGVSASLTASQASAQAFSYSLAGGSDGWPAETRAAVVRAMDEAVATYNRFGHFEKHDTANYNPGVPTAQANYSGWIDFGTQFSTRVALHEIAHTLGIGTYWGFDGGTWSEDSAAGRLIKLFDGQAAVLSTGGSHFWPYGLNYDQEDGLAARERHVKLVSAFRFDMGIVADSDGDGLPDDWEIHHFGGLDQTAQGDPDDDGVTNQYEYATDCDPTVAAPLIDGHVYVLRNQRGQRALSVIGASIEETAGTELREAEGKPEQAWRARYVGDGWFSLTNVNSEKVLEVPSTDTTSGLPVQQASWTGSLRQQWRVTVGEGADPGNYQIANRETARLVDGLDGADGTAVKQYPYLGNITQQYWSFEDVTPEGPSEGDAGTSAAPDGSSSDGGTPSESDASASGPTEQPGTADAGAAPNPFARHQAGCALAGRSDDTMGTYALGLSLLALGFVVRRARRRELSA